MPELPPAAPRRLVHTREVKTCGHLRDDGLWDIEGELTDTKTYGYHNADGKWCAPGAPVHRMLVRLTLDDNLTVRDAAVAMQSAPFPECQGAAPPLQALVGQTIGAGWRKLIDAAMGGTRGCTHVRDLLAAMATVAFQTVPGYRAHERRLRGEAAPAAQQPGFQMGRCLGWDFDGPVIARVAPQFVGWKTLSPPTPKR